MQANCCNVLPKLVNLRLFIHTRAEPCAMATGVCWLLILGNRRGCVNARWFKGVNVPLTSALADSVQHTWLGEVKIGDIDKTRAVISSTASQELFDYAVSAICACVIQPSPSVSAAGLRLPVSLLFILLMAFSQACIIVRNIGKRDDVTVQVAWVRLRSLLNGFTVWIASLCDLTSLWIL